jgi:hypothetical protein
MDGLRQCGTLRLSVAQRAREQFGLVKKRSKSFEERKHEILYAIFLVASVFLIYFAMCPTRRA